jgi:hypothetical protein
VIFSSICIPGQWGSIISSVYWFSEIQMKALASRVAEIKIAPPQETQSIQASNAENYNEEGTRGEDWGGDKGNMCNCWRDNFQ